MDKILVQYSDSDGEIESVKCEESENIHSKKVQLPKPHLSAVRTTQQEFHYDDPSQHGGRLRAFPHERGNWPTLVFVSGINTEAVFKFVKELKKLDILKEWEFSDNLHVSLSRTVTLRYHWINTFCESLKSLLHDTESFELDFTSIKAYCNDDKTRTFIALHTDHFANKDLAKITAKIDTVLSEFKLPTYYKDPSFHVSVLWTCGDKLQDITDLLPQLQAILDLSKDPFRSVIDQVICKCGNKTFFFPLKD